LAAVLTLLFIFVFVLTVELELLPLLMMIMPPELEPAGLEGGASTHVPALILKPGKQVTHTPVCKL
jgi:hypothetical protein